MKRFNNKKLILVLIAYCMIDSSILQSTNKQLNQEEIFQAAQQGNIDIFISLMQNKENLNIKDKDGNTLFHIAAKNGHYKLINLLAEYNAPQGLKDRSYECLFGSKRPDINAQNNDGDTALLYAIEHNNDALEALIYLLWNNANPNTTNKKKYTALLRAAQKGKKKETLYLMGMSDEYYNQTIDGNNILHVTFNNNHNELAQVIITTNSAVFAQNPERCGQNALVKSKNAANETVLFCCAKANNLEALKLLLPIDAADEKPTINIPNIHGYTPFAYLCHRSDSSASYASHKEAINLFLQHKPELNKATFSHAMPIHIAMSSNNYDLAAQLLQNGADINACDYEHGNTPLLIATYNNDKTKIDWLLKHGANIKQQNKFNEDALGAAITKKHKNLIPFFISLGGSIETTDSNGRTWLMRELAKNNNDMASYLIELKANTNHTDIHGHTALHIATKNKNINGAKLLLQHNKQLINKPNKYGNTPLHFAADNVTSSQFVTLYLSHNAFINSQNIYGETPLHRAVAAGNIEIIQCLKNNKASLALLTKNNNSAAHYALMHNKINCLSSLLDKEIINIINNDGQTILLLAIQKQLKHSMLKKIIECGADIRQISKNGDTYLHHAIISKNPDAIDIFAIPSLINLKNNSNGSPLSYAAQQDSIAAVRLLLQRNALPNAADDNGWTELHHAIVFSDITMFKLLHTHGSSAKKITRDSDTCLHIAAQYNKTDIIKEIIKDDPNLKRKNDKNETPFMIAAHNNCFEAAQLLVSEDDFNDGTVEIVLKKIKYSYPQSETHRFLEKELSMRNNACNDID